MANTIFYSHDYPDDTKYTYEVRSDGCGQITMEFTSEDPDCGTEVLIYAGDVSETELRHELLNEIAACLDRQEAGRPMFVRPLDYDLDYYDQNYTRTALIAFECMLLEMKR